MNDNSDLFEKLVELLTVFDQVCKKNSLRYYAFAGTMLGAIRHHGIIPWDDDIDLVMPRSDYNKLKQLANDGVFSEPYFFQTPETDEGYPKGFSRLRNSNTTEIEYIDFATKCNHGIFMDIFPLDKVPNSIELFHKQTELWKYNER